LKRSVLANTRSGYEHFHDEADILDEDYPWRMTKAEFVDHIAFHATSGLWEFFQWVPRELHFLVVGQTGLLDCSWQTA
jgi:hypothetical protein